jgi:5-methylcytosine-specific restriction endonuclease McrA
MEHRLTQRPLWPMQVPKSCLVCSKRVEASNASRSMIRTEHLAARGTLTGAFCSRRCSSIWKKQEKGRRQKCTVCCKKTGWSRSPVKCLECKEARKAARFRSVKCEHCDGVFTQYVKGSTQGRFCSQGCYKEYKAAHTKRFTCEACGKLFFKQRSGGGANKFCSRECGGSELTVEERERRKSVKLLNVLNRRAKRDEAAWRSERPKPCKPCRQCGLAKSSRNWYCEPCRESRRLQHKALQNARYGDFHRSGVREMVIERDGGVCQYCQVFIGSDAVVDHIQPVSAGGTNDPMNLLTSCRMCNSIKSDMPTLNLLFNPNWLSHIQAVS